MELAEVVVPGELAAAERAGSAQGWLREGVAYRHHHRLEAVLAQRLGRAAARAHVVDDLWECLLARRSFSVSGSRARGAGDDGNQVVGLDEFAALVHEHRAVRVTVEDDAAVEPVLAHDRRDLRPRLRLERIGTVRGKLSVDGSVDDLRAREKLTREQRRHSVRAVHRVPERTIRRRRGRLALPTNVARQRVRDLRRAPSFHSAYQAAFADHLLYLVEPVSIADWQRAATRNLETIVRRRIVRGGHHHRAVVSVLGSEEVDHRRRCESQVRDLHARLGQPADERVAHRLAGSPAVASDQPAPAGDHPRQRRSDAADEVQVEVGPEGAAHVVCLEKAHRNSVTIRCSPAAEMVSDSPSASSTQPVCSPKTQR